MADRVVKVRLVGDVSSYVAGMGKAAGSTAALGSTVDATTRKTSSGLGSIGTAGMVAGGLLAAGFGMAISRSMEFESSMSAVQAATGATAATLGDLREAAMRAGADTQYSATEAADAITEMSKAGVSAADIMGGGLSGALSLAAAGQIDVAQAAEIASIAMTQFNLSGSDLPHVADLLAAGAGKAIGSVDDLGQALNQAGLVASAAGFDIEETTGVLSAFASAGLIGSDAGTSLKVAIQSLQAPSGKAAELMAELGLNMYDANGNMLGAAEIAGQLQSQLGGLTEEQRNNALATIFGSDAVRAANVLYREGEAGIRNWTDAVNDAGFASEQARALNDNLRGDLERLSGAFETLMIDMGSGAQGPLRDVVQALTSMVDVAGSVYGVLSDLPGPVYAIAAALTVMYLANGPLSAGLATLGANIGNVATKASGALTSVGGFKSAIGGLASAISPASLAMGAATLILPSLIDGLQSLTGASDEAKAAQQDLTAALEASNGALDDNARAAAAKAAEDAGILAAAERAGIGLDLVTDAVLGQADAYERVRTALGESQINNVGNPEQLEAVRQAQNALDELYPTAAATADAQARIAEATGESTAAMGPATDATAALAEETDTYSDQLSDANKEIDELVASLAILTGANNSMLAAENAVGAAVAAATDALDEQGGTVLDVNGNLNSYSENGRAASDVLLDMANSSNELIATMIQQGDSVEAVTARDAELRASFIQTANQMGIVGADAERLADQIYGIPADRATRITADTSQAETAVQAFVARVTGTRVTLTGDFVGGAGVNVRRAAGGPVWGAGTGTSDSIPAMLSNGEYVVRAAAVSKYGVAALDAINQGRPSDLALFAAGGLVDNYSVPVALSGLERIQVAIDAATSGPAGGGALGAGWSSIWNIVKAAIPQARINSTVRPGDPGYHGRGKAIDFGFGSGPGGAGSAGLASIARYLYNGFGSTLAELIYDGVGDDTPDVKNGRPHTYNAATRAQHANHVHAAVYDQGGMLPSGMAALNLSGSPEMVLNPAQTAQTAAAMRSREFSGGSSAGGSSGPVSFVIEGAEITGTLQVGGDGLMRIVDGRIVQALTVVKQRGTYNP